MNYFMSYITEVTDFFISRCSRPGILSPADYALIAEWEKEGVPLEVVIKTLDCTSNSLLSNHESPQIESIDYFQNEIKYNYAEWLRSSENQLTKLKSAGS